MDLWWLSEPAERRPSWERRWPGRLGWELARLTERGRLVDIDRTAWSRGVLAIHYGWTSKGREHLLLLTYPPGFPATRPDVYLVSDRRSLPRRHCDPLSGRLCYLGHHRHAWGPGMSIAEVLDEQLPKIIDGLSNAEEEEAIGEPAENWWNQMSSGDSMLAIDSNWRLPAVPGGSLMLRVRVEQDPAFSLRALCAEVTGPDGAQCAAWTQALPVEFRDAPLVKVPWVRLDAELFPRDQNEGYRAVLAAVGKVPVVRLAGGLHAKLFAGVFPTEIAYGKTGDGWLLFAARGLRRDLEQDREDRTTCTTVRTMRAGVADLTVRVPDAAPLLGKRLVVVGVGAIGAPIAMELARHGIASLTLVDGDRITPGNGIRWPFAESAWGRMKVDVLRRRIGEEHAGVEVTTFPHFLGELDLEARDGEGAILRALIDGADAVIDASTAFDAATILADQCGRAGIPLICVNATPSLEGGAVVRHVRGGGCPTCLVLHQSGPAPTLPSPPGDDGDATSVALPGCAEATFSGASYDLGELSLETVRLIVRTLRDGGGPGIVETLAFQGTERLPSWRVDPLERHHDCGCA